MDSQPIYDRVAKDRAATAKVRRDALAYCVDCRNPLLATEYGFQFCPYERAGQHAKVSRARNPHQVMAGCAQARDAARDTAGRFAPTGTGQGSPAITSLRQVRTPA